MKDDGGESSAAAWIAAQGNDGDFSRRFILDPAILPIIRAGGFQRALDVGCGEGRFCRMLAAEGLDCVGLDPTAALLTHARQAHAEGTYVEGMAEQMPFRDAAFDLVVSYLSLIDIADFRAGIAEMARVLAPGGTMIVANITDFRSALMDVGWICSADGAKRHYPVDRYLEERAVDVAWDGIAIRNWHRPLAAYMQTFLAQGLLLRHFDNPPVIGGAEDSIESYNRAPWLVLMVWQKPEDSRVQ